MRGHHSRSERPFAGIGATQACLKQTLLLEQKLRQATISALEQGAPGTELRTLIDVMTALGLEMVVRERSKSKNNIEDLY